MSQQALDLGEPDPDPEPEALEILIAWPNGDVLIQPMPVPVEGDDDPEDAARWVAKLGALMSDERATTARWALVPARGRSLSATLPAESWCVRTAASPSTSTTQVD